MMINLKLQITETHLAKVINILQDQNSLMAYLWELKLMLNGHLQPILIPQHSNMNYYGVKFVI